MRWVKLRYLWFLCLILSACQPYPDNVEPIHDFRADSLDFGVRRELRLIRVEGDQTELLLVFNQPLQRLSEQEEAVPFQLDFRPRLPVSETSRFGAASIRVRFASQLPPAQSYTATIPNGWRALTGAAFLRSQEVSWETPRARLLEVHYEEEESAGFWRLSFNQAVDLDSLKACLQIEDRDRGEVLEEARIQLSRSESGQIRLTILEAPQLRLRLSLKPGLKSLGGPLLGEGGESFELEVAQDTLFLESGSRWLPEEGLLRLLFSSSVSERELRRSLKGLAAQQVEIRTDDQREYFLSFPELKGRIELTILKSLRAMDGTHLSREVSIGLSNAEQQMERKSISRRFLRVDPGKTVMPTTSPPNSQVASWKLTDKQALELLKLSEEKWSSRGKLALELTKPVYSASTKVGRDATRFLPESHQTFSKGEGKFLVRRALEGGKVERTLVARSALHFDSWSLNGVVSVFVGSSSEQGSAGIRLQLLDWQGQVLSEALSGPDGVTSFPQLKGREAVLVRALSDGNSVYHNLRPYSLPGPRFVPGLLWIHGSVFQAGSKARFVRLCWMEEQNSELEVVNSSGTVVNRFSVPQTERDLFTVGEFEVPKEEGQYGLRFAGANSAYRPGPTFSVSQLCQHFDEASSSLSLVERENSLYGGSYQWLGPKAAQLDLRASMHPKVSELNGWRMSYPDLPNSLPVKVAGKTETLDGVDYLLDALPVLKGLWSLELELYDKRSPEAVIHRVKRDLGEEILKLIGAEVKVLSPKVRMGRFRFLFHKGENGPRRALKCRFLEQDPETASGWRALAEGQAIWRDGAYEWNTSFSGSGVFRIQCDFESPKAELQSMTWERALYSEAAIDGQEVLELSPPLTRPGHSLRVRWPELQLGTPVWLSVLSDGGEVSSSRRFADDGGDLGQVSVPATHAGQSEVIVVAALESGPTSPVALRTRIVRMKRDSLAEPLNLDLEGGSGGEGVLGPGSPLIVPLRDVGTPQLSLGVFWWSEAEEPFGPSLRLAGGGQDAGERAKASMRSSRLPLLGPVELSGKDEIELSSPQFPGSYTLHVLALDKSRKLYLAEHPIKVKRLAHWETLMPPWVRPGDQFWAGVRFWASPEEKAPTGSICSAELTSELLPQSYFTTAALTDAGKVGDMLFSYQAPSFALAKELEDLQLKWLLGVDGNEFLVSADLKLLPTPYKELPFRKRLLKSGERVRLDTSSLSHWKLRLSTLPSLESEQSTELSVSGETLAAQLVELTRPNPAWETYGTSSELTLWHKTGEPVQVDLLDLQGRSPLEKPSADGLYVLRELQTESGVPLPGGAVMDQENIISYHLVLPDSAKNLQLVSPLPGGFQALGCWLRTEEALQPLDWEMVREEMVVYLPELQAGEHRVVVSVKAVVGGEFQWPSSRVVGTEDKIWGRTQNSSVSVRRK